VNVLINNVSPDEWPTGLEQTTGFAFYDTKSDDDLGEPSEPDSDLFERQLRDLVDALYDLLRTTKEAGAGARPPYPPVTSRTYPQRQAELALEHAASTLIWIPHDLQIAEIDDENHRAFLEQLQRDERVADFIQSGPDEITRIILEKIEQAQGASESGNDASSHRHLSARVVGRVQGVNFRTFIRKEAQALGLTGWVRNERDGSVSMEAEGSHAALETLLAAARRGPAMARVDHVEVDWSEATGKFDEFALRF
jgi:acylphosphatase